uniref:Uncharacterized protein n=1 Tax=Sinocyclocheilus anshuiensis TaxID=1608454 RepID=A0A671P4J4_9TELE
MDVFGFLNLNELALGLSNLSMFPCFDMAHYIISVMSLREQPGALEVSQRSPFACWFSSMLYCFGGAVLSALMMADAPVAPLSNTTNLLLCVFMCLCVCVFMCVCVVFYCPLDAVYSLASVLPVRLLLTAMKEVTRTWKVLGGVTQAGRKYKDGLFVMIAVGWAKGAGGGLLSNFEQLVREVFRLLFQTRMMLLGSSSYPFSAVESLVYKTLFVRPLTFSPLTDSSPIRNKPNGSASDEPDQTNPQDAENTKKTD